MRRISRQWPGQWAGGKVGTWSGYWPTDASIIDRYVQIRHDDVTMTQVEVHVHFHQPAD